MSTPRFLKTEDIQSLMGGLSTTTIRRWVKRGWLPRPFRLGRRRYYDESEVIASLRARREVAE